MLLRFFFIGGFPAKIGQKDHKGRNIGHMFETFRKVKNTAIRNGISVILMTALMLGELYLHPMEAKADNEIVLCIDPGHGGANLGATYNGFEEKNLTLQIANVMTEYLSHFEGIRVVRTRTEDVDLSLEERAQIAKDNQAFMLLSLHLNASEPHHLFGAEVWTSAFGDLYAWAHSFGEIELQELANLGIYPKHVKTRMSSQAVDEYYGILRHAKNRGIPAAIIEHCYMDEIRDEQFYTSEEAIVALGQADAIAVAKFFGLKSPDLGLDFTGYQRNVYTAPELPVYQDKTPPEVRQISLNAYDPATRVANLHIRAKDSDSGILFFRYSTDGGITWSPLYPWTAEEGDVEIPVIASSNGDVVLKLYNGFDGAGATNHLKLW